MTRKTKWIIGGVIAAVLVVGLAAGAVGVIVAQRTFWGYPRTFTANFGYHVPFAPNARGGQGFNGPMVGRGSRGNSPEFRGYMGRGGFGPGAGMGRGYYGPMRGGPIMGGPIMGEGFRRGGAANSLLNIAAEQLGMTTSDLTTQLQSGQTIADLAKAKDVSLDKIVEAMLAPRSEQLSQLVSNGVLTQEQADARLATMKTDLTARLSEQWSPGTGWGGGPLGRWQ